MKAVLQRVVSAAVKIDGDCVGKIEKGILLLLGVDEGDTNQECDFLAQKAVTLRIFEDENGKMNKSLCDIGGEMLVVSQFTLCADCKNGRRPSCIHAALPPVAESLYRRFTARVNEAGIKTANGRFGADMLVTINNDGPVTIVLDTKEIMPQKNVLGA
ncbi:MAG: D-aminoacyl-tRNA deacylase [Hydrogenoanaerobacterium sp.]